MGSMPLALSVHNFITSVGADAGFASIIGLAILVLLYFAHAKDTANLHEEADELSHRLLEAETRLAQLSRQQPAPAPAPAAVAFAPASQAARSAAASPIRAARAGAAAIAVPAAPVGVGAPALASATRMIPAVSADPDPDQDLAADAEPVVDDQQAEPAVPAGAQQVAAAQGARAAAASAPVKERPAGPVGPTPATAAGAANGGNGERRAAAPVGVGAPPESPPRPRVQIRSGAPAAAARRPVLPPRSPAPRSGAGRRFVLLVGALIAVAAIAALVIITATGGSSSSQSHGAATSNAPGTVHRATPPSFNPSSVTVAVLNGTATNELAHRVAAKLTAVGYKQGNVFTASNQTQTATVVAYLPGSRNDALHVATALKLGPASVQAIDSNTQQVACPPPSPCTANVVVTVGADLATL